MGLKFTCTRSNRGTKINNVMEKVMSKHKHHSDRVQNMTKARQNYKSDKITSLSTFSLGPFITINLTECRAETEKSIGNIITTQHLSAGKPNSKQHR